MTESESTARAVPSRHSISPGTEAWLAEHPVWTSVLVGALALILRLLYLYQVSDTPYYLPHTLDPRFYFEWAREIASGNWLGDRIFVQSPLYAYLLAPFIAIFGEGKLTFHGIHLFQALVGTATCVLTIQIGRRVFGNQEALLAGVLVAAYGPFLFYEGMLMKTFLSTFFTLLLVELLFRSNGVRLALLVAAGLVFALTSLVRDNFVLLFPLLLVGIYFSFSSLTRRQRGRNLALFTLGAALGILPVTARNYAVGGEFALLTAGGGEVFYIGNNADANGRYLPPPFVHADPQKEHDDFIAKARELSGRELTQGESSRFWLRQGLAWIGENPGSWLRLLSQKLIIFWNGYELPDNYNFVEVRHLLLNPVTIPGLLLFIPLHLVTFGLIAPLGLTGIFLSWRKWRQLLLVYLVLFGYMGTVLLFFNFSRFRVPVVPFLCLFASATLLTFYQELRLWVQYLGRGSTEESSPAAPSAGSRWAARPSLVMAPLLLLALLLVVNFVGTGGRGVFPYLQARLSLGDAYRTQERFTEAETEYRLGLQVIGDLPLDAATAAGLGVDPLQMRQEVESERMAQGVNFGTVRAGLHFGLGAVWMERGRERLDRDRAEGEELIRKGLAEVEQAAKMVPFPPYMRRLAEGYTLLGLTREAEETYRRAMTMAPQDFGLHYDLAGLLYETGRYAEALSELRTARQAKTEFSPVELSDYHFGMGLLRLDGYRDRGKSLYHLRKALEIHPTHREAERIRELIAELESFGAQPEAED